MKKLLSFTFCVAFLSTLFWRGAGGEVAAQDNVGIGTNMPNPSSMLDVLSANKGVLIPRMNTAAMNAIPVSATTNGLIIYNTDSSCFCYYNSTAWVSLCNAGGPGPTGPTGPGGTNGINGVTGPTGVAGTNGATGPTGAAGTNGTNGATGATGATGTAGTNGTNGATGATGATGTAGTNGTNGATGATGATGTAGTNGTNGVTGATGTTGTAGLNGATGATGAAGTAGLNGATGATGPTGPVGCASTNYIIKSNGTNATCTQAPIFESSTSPYNVGIRTTIPSYQLHVISPTTTNGETSIFGTLSGSSGSGVVIKGIWGDAPAAITAGRGIYGTAAGTEGKGVYGRATAASGSTIGAQGTDDSPNGWGVYGVTTYVPAAGLQVGVGGAASGTNGFGVAGWGSGVSTISFPTNGYPGGDFGAPRYGVYAREMDSVTAGSSITTNYYTGAEGYAKVQVAASGSYYHFGLYGMYDNSAGAGFGRVSGGVFGYATDGTAVSGCLGYENTGSNMYALYYSGGTNTTALKSFGSKNSYAIGMGGFGDLMGGWVRGNIYGMNIKGNRYSLYVDGKTYTNDVIAQLSDNGSSGRTVSYFTTSKNVDVYDKGTGTLSNGRAYIAFDKEYRDMISSSAPVIVTATPMGKSNGVYIESSDANGFTVAENDGGTSNVSFSWMAAGTKRGYENPDNPSELLSLQYDENMRNVMTNDFADQQQSALPIWWDGYKLRFDEHPKEFGNELLPHNTLKSLPADPKENHGISGGLFPNK